MVYLPQCKGTYLMVASKRYCRTEKDSFRQLIPTNNFQYRVNFKSSEVSAKKELKLPKKQ